MAPDDVYIPMAARIKLFEKGLGNGSNKPAPIVSNLYYYAFNLIMCNNCTNNTPPENKNVDTKI